MPPAENKAMREEAEQLVALIGEKPVRFWQELIAAAEAKIPSPLRPEPSPPTMPRPASDDYAEAGELAEWIDEHYTAVPSRAAEWADDVADTARSIYRTIDERSRVTERQLEALRNIKNALEAWMR